MREMGVAGLPQPTVDLADVVYGGHPPDGVPALDTPHFLYRRRALDGDSEQVLEVGGEARVSPGAGVGPALVNDTVGEVPVAVMSIPPFACLAF